MQRIPQKIVFLEASTKRVAYAVVAYAASCLACIFVSSVDIFSFSVFYQTFFEFYLQENLKSGFSPPFEKFRGPGGLKNQKERSKRQPTTVRATYFFRRTISSTMLCALSLAFSLVFAFCRCRWAALTVSASSFSASDFLFAFLSRA